MADIDIQQEFAIEDEDDYTYGDVLYWVIGILCIPAVPILMSWLFTPWSGM